MSIYIHIPNIQGNVTKKEHANWIEIDSLNVSANRHINMQVGKMYDRTSSTPNFSEISFTKELDKASSLLFALTHNDKALNKVTIDVCASSTSTKAYSQYILSDVLLSKYHVSYSNNAKAQEHISLSYSKIETVFNGLDESSSQTPVRAGFDLTEAKKL